MEKILPITSRKSSGTTYDSVKELDVLTQADSLQETALNSDYSDLQDAFVDTCEGIASLIDVLVNLPISPPSLYIDLEGINLSRNGSISILQLLVYPRNRTFLLDIHILGDKAFTTPGADGQSMKDILESDAIPKAFFDVRNDSDALFHHFGIRLAGIQDIQLMELATRTFSKRCVHGLSKCIERDLSLGINEIRAWKKIKDKGRILFAPECGGSYDVFNSRPLSEDIWLYCVQDVQFMPRLWIYYQSKLKQNWADKVRQETKNRVILSQTMGYNGKGRHMALGPW